MSEAAKTEGDKSGEPAETPPAVDAAKPGNKPLIGRTAAVGIGIGSAALVAALLYASRGKPNSKK